MISVVGVLVRVNTYPARNGMGPQVIGNVEGLRVVLPAVVNGVDAWVGREVMCRGVVESNKYGVSLLASGIELVNVKG